MHLRGAVLARPTSCRLRTLKFLRAHGAEVALAVACASVWFFVLYHAGKVPDWRVLGPLALVVYECIIALRFARQRDRAIREAPDTATARRLEANAYVWDDRRLERILSGVRQDEGSDAADRLEAEIASARAATPLLLRPVRGLGYVAAFALLLVVVGLVVLLNR